MSISKLSNIHCYTLYNNSYPLKNPGRYRHGLMYTLEGTEIYHFSDITLKAVPDSILYLPQNEKYIIELKDERSVVYIIDFDVVDKEEIRPFLIKFDKTNQIKNNFLQAEKLWLQKKDTYMANCKNLFYRTISRMISQTSSYTNMKQFSILEESINYLREHYLENDFRIDVLYELADVSPKYYTTLFRNMFNMTPKEYTTLLRIEYAKGLLLSEKTTLQNVAISVGYSDVYQFSKMFKSKIGFSPTEYRKKNFKDGGADIFLD